MRYYFLENFVILLGGFLGAGLVVFFSFTIGNIVSYLLCVSTEIVLQAENNAELTSFV